MSHPSWLGGPQWTDIPATDEVPAHSIYTGPLPRPVIDDRVHRLIRLANGIQAVLVHDPEADKAAASLHVGVGHLQDPVRSVYAVLKRSHFDIYDAGRRTRFSSLLRAHDHEGRCLLAHPTIRTVSRVSLRTGI